MTEEMFMKLLEMVGNAGEGGFTLAIIYLMKGYVLTGIWVTALVYLAKKMISAVSEDARQLKTLNDVGNIVGVNPYSSLSPKEARTIIERVERLKANQK